ncbi:LysR family transcriptional regulator [Azohydromonas lata]|uniref:LysR substrate-binding domain-containing protein n=1 Tax=Azohydromonas lata TaxID=45677 RepID=A0ABU5IFQ7_9BURK|nr:LysR substrate-binding domain-containing protein [Azohydromonas lata]MDZ5457952.1 LysR substrate-binding domain-containing protein [Azohydromonas lata]
MDFKQLRALVTVAETGNVTRASTVLNIVQPAVSRQLKLLEEELGVTLFERSRHGMDLTEAGRTLVEYARRVLNELDRARAEIAPARGSIGGIVTVGLLPSACDLLSSALVTAVAARYPGIRVRISMGYAGYLQRWLEAGEIDTALLYDPKPTPAIQTRQLLEEGLWAVGLPDSGLKRDVPVTLRELATKPLILPSAPHGIRALVDHAAALQSLQLQVVAETNALSVQRSLVLGGHGLTILPSIAVAEDIARGLLNAAPLTQPTLLRKIVLALPTNRQTTLPVRCVVELLVETMREAVDRKHWPAARWLAE